MNATPVPTLLRASALTSLLFSGAIFGFFYAWVCSTMWGLDAADPRIAISAMQAMNASVRNVVFAPAFFGTPAVLALTAALAWASDRRGAAGFFLAGAALYLFGGMILTMVVNVPMNQALATQAVPTDAEAAREIWQAYSAPWQVWNQTRTVLSGGALLLAGLGAMRLR